MSNMEIDNRPVLMAYNTFLYPYIPGSMGWSIWWMLKSRVPEVTRHDYLKAFDRHNLEDTYYARTAFRHRTVLAFGDVACRLGLPKQLIHPQVIDEVIWRQLPHPNDDWYDDPKHVALASMVLESLYALSMERHDVCF